MAPPWKLLALFRSSDPSRAEAEKREEIRSGKILPDSDGISHCFSLDVVGVYGSLFIS